MRSPLGTLLCLLALLPASTALAQAGAIIDPENPGAGVIVDPENPGAGVIVDPQNPGAGVIVDPENPGAGAIVDPQNPGAGAIVDPENPGAGTVSGPPRPAAPTASSARDAGAGTPRAFFRGTVQSLASVDTAHDDAWEDTLTTLQRFGARMRYRISDRWTATLEGRVTWWLNANGDESRPVLRPDLSERQGRLEPELRELVVAGRAGRVLIRAGQTTAVWGSTDLSGIGDVIHPRDQRLGPLATPDEARIPVPLLDATAVWDGFAAQLVVVPFFVPDRATIYGGDFALLRPGSALAAGLPLGLITNVVDPSLEDLVQPLLVQSERPEEHLGNASLGTRLTASPRGWDLSLGWFWGWDRTPRLVVDDAVRALGDIGAGTLPNVLLPDSDLFGALSAVQAAFAGGAPLVSATYERLHSVVLDGVTYAGPVGVRFDVVASPEKTLTLADARSVRRPSLSAALGLGYEDGTGDFIVATELVVQHAFTRDGDGAAAYGLDDVLAILAGVEWSPAAVARWSDRRSARLSLRLGGAALPREGDALISPSVGWSFTEASSLSLGATVTILGDHIEATIGDFISPTDAVFARFETSF